jgi:uncharacterized protein YbcI
MEPEGPIVVAVDEPLRGSALLDAVSASMVGLHRRYHHRKPVTAKSQMMGDDLLACVMGGVYTDVEKTLIELQRPRLVQEARSAFQEAMQDRFVSEVERLSGRRVETFVSNSVVGPDLEIELFFLAAPQ